MRGEADTLWGMASLFFMIYICAPLKNKMPQEKRRPAAHQLQLRIHAPGCAKSMNFCNGHAPAAAAAQFPRPAHSGKSLLPNRSWTPDMVLNRKNLKN